MTAHPGVTATLTPTAQQQTEREAMALKLERTSYTTGWWWGFAAGACTGAFAALGIVIAGQALITVITTG